ncbi:hypothetical protein RB195_014518 [Necator americanus]|uniref:Uncharacterized protein n=1 Tax=Necator americanus TaxID=51031 RepID=A0ABR1E0F5_NECAM
MDRRRDNRRDCIGYNNCLSKMKPLLQMIMSSPTTLLAFVKGNGWKYPLRCPSDAYYLRRRLQKEGSITMKMVLGSGAQYLVHFENQILNLRCKKNCNMLLIA